MKQTGVTNNHTLWHYTRSLKTCPTGKTLRALAEILGFKPESLAAAEYRFRSVVRLQDFGALDKELAGSVNFE